MEGPLHSILSRSGWGWGGGGGWGWGQVHHHSYHDQNLDLYSLLGGLSFASLLGATIIYLATRNTSGRRRRSLDGGRFLEDDEDEGLHHNGVYFSDILKYVKNLGGSSSS